MEKLPKITSHLTFLSYLLSFLKIVPLHLKILYYNEKLKKRKKRKEIKILKKIRSNLKLNCQVLLRNLLSPILMKVRHLVKVHALKKLMNHFRWVKKWEEHQTSLVTQSAQKIRKVVFLAFSKFWVNKQNELEKILNYYNLNF